MTATVAWQYATPSMNSAHGIQVTLSDASIPEVLKAELFLRMFCHQVIDVLPLDGLAEAADGLSALCSKTVNVVVPAQPDIDNWGMLLTLAGGYIVPQVASDATTTPSLPDTLAALPNRLKAMAWEEQGMVVPDGATITYTGNVLTALMLATPGLAQPDVVATPAGGIQLEWHTGTFDLEINVSAPSEADAYLLHVKTGQTREFEDLQSVGDFGSLSEALNKLL